MNKFVQTLFIALLTTGLTLAGCAKNEGSEKIANLVYANWEEGVAYTHLAQAVLEDKMGYTVNLTAADVAPAYAAVSQGDQDAFMETWLPVLHKDYVEKYQDKIINLGKIFEGTESGLVVPQYMIDAGVDTISDLLNPATQQKLNLTITGIDAGAGIMSTTENEIMPTYGLDKAGYKLVPSSGPAMMASLKKAVENNEWIVVTGWKPHSMFGYWKLAFLEQDGEKVWGQGDIYIMGRKDIEADKPELAQFLKNMSLTNDELGSLMVYIAESDADTVEAAREWMNQNESIVAGWAVK